MSPNAEIAMFVYKLFDMCSLVMDKSNFLYYSLSSSENTMQAAKDTTTYIYDTLKNEILTLTLKPGVEIAEADLCKRFKASRTPVRTALQRLADTGLVEIVPYQYTRVSLINFDKAEQMIYLRSAIESRVIQDFMGITDPFILEDLEHIVRKQEIMLSSTFRPEDFSKLDTDFHAFFFREAGKEYIWQLITESEDYNRLRMLDVVEIRDFYAILEDHKMILDMVKNRDRKGIPALLERHLRSSLNRIREKAAGKYEFYFIRSQV